MFWQSDRIEDFEFLLKQDSCSEISKNRSKKKKKEEKSKTGRIGKWAFQHKNLGICLRWKFLDPQKYIESSFSTMNQCKNP